MLDLPPLRDGLGAQRAAQLLDEGAAIASNIRSMSPGQGLDGFRDDYLRHTDDLSRRLAQVFDYKSPDVNGEALPTSDYVRTDEYWRIRGADIAMPRLVAFIHEEAEALEHRFAQLRDRMRAEDARWGRRSCVLAVPDTTMFLTKDLPIGDIDWQTSLDATEAGVALVVPLVTIHELDRLKRQGNSTTGTAARKSIQWLLEHLPGNPDKPSQRLPSSGRRDTTIEVYVHPGPTRPSDADGVIIDFARRLAPITRLPCRLVTRDFGMKLRAQHHGCDAQLLPAPEPVKRPSAAR
ncbi:PIN domain-containing protein [Kribbella sp. NPDC054772]